MSDDPRLEEILTSHCRPHPIPEGLLEALRDWARGPGEDMTPRALAPTPGPPPTASMSALISPPSLDRTWGPDTAPPSLVEPATRGAAPPRSPPALPERYTFEGALGAGGMGTVSRVRDRVLGRAVALKRLHNHLSPWSDILARFVEEAQVTAQLEHPGILPLYDLGQLSDGQWYYTMPVVRGHTLAHAIARAHQRGPLTAPSRRHLVGLFHRACEAIAYAHARGVIHRDLKPLNIMVGDHGAVTVLDWGLAKLMNVDARTRADAEAVHIERPRSGAMATQAGQIAGTPGYMAPEQERGEIDRLDARSDVYALGAILMELLGGPVPFQRGASSDLEALRSGGCPAALLEISQRALAQEMSARFADAGEMTCAIGDWLDGVQRRQKALEVVAGARAAEAEAAALPERARGRWEGADDAQREEGVE